MPDAFKSTGPSCCVVVSHVYEQLNPFVIWVQFVVGLNPGRVDVAFLRFIVGCCMFVCSSVMLKFKFIVPVIYWYSLWLLLLCC